MPAADEVRVALAILGPVGDNQGESVTVNFGIGIRGAAVRLWGIHYTVSAIGTTLNEFLDFACALSEDPGHLLEPFTVPSILLTSPKVYGVFYVRQQMVISTNGATILRAFAKEIPLHGILRPSRQVFTVVNRLNDAVQVRAEIYYSPVGNLSRAEVDGLNRQKGAIRRT